MPQKRFAKQVGYCWLNLRESDREVVQGLGGTVFFFAETFPSLLSETLWSLRHAFHLSQGCIKTRRKSIFCLYFQTFWPNDLIFFGHFKQFSVYVRKKAVMWSDVISDLAWSRLGLEPAELSEIAVDREVFQALLELFPPRPPLEEKRAWKWIPLTSFSLSTVFKSAQLASEQVLRRLEMTDTNVQTATNDLPIIHTFCKK